MPRKPKSSEPVSADIHNKNLSDIVNRLDDLVHAEDHINMKRQNLERALAWREKILSKPENEATEAQLEQVNHTIFHLKFSLGLISADGK
jgi:queuine/archaeosine tRNA-ribosyltransferase